MTAGGRAGATSIRAYQVYVDGFKNQVVGSSAARSVILMLIGVRGLRHSGAGMQDIGMVADRKGLGHTDCGGLRVVRA